jgi:putative endonuclease
VYILQCADNRFYVGSTTNLEVRLQDHAAGIGANFTRERLPVKLVYYEEYNRIEDAFKRETQIHKWSHAKKEALIRGEIRTLKALSECKNRSHHKFKHSNPKSPNP